ncbi:CmcI family methyltransferase [Thermocrinis sp.]
MKHETKHKGEKIKEQELKEDQLVIVSPEHPKSLPYLKDIAIAHLGKLSDKWEGYYEVYEQLFLPYRNEPVSILEIGVQNGGFLEILSSYFWRAKAVVGCDIDKRCSELSFSDSRIRVIVGDIKDKDTVRKILEISSSYNIIIDDSSHTQEDIIKAFANLFPHLKDGGIYIVEDLHASYWKSYEGGIYKPTTAINFFKRLLDIVNYESWGVGIQRKEVIKPILEYYQIDIDEFELAHIRSVEFYNSLCVIRKDKPEKTYIGKRMIVGTHETVTEGFFRLRGIQLRDLANQMQVSLDFENDPFVLNRKLHEKDEEINKLSEIITTLEQEKEDLINTIETLTQAINYKEQELKDLNAQLEQKSKLYEELIGEKERLTKELENQEKYIQEQTFKLEVLEREKNDLLNTIETLIQTINQREQELKELLAQLEQKNRLYEELVSEKEKLVKELEDRDSSIEYLNYLVQSKEEYIQEQTSKLEALEQEKNELIQTINQREQELKELLAQLEHKDILYQEQTSKLEALIQAVEQKDRELKELYSQLEQGKNENDQLVNRINELTKQLQEKEQIIERLSNEKGMLFISLMELKNSWYWRYIGKPLSRLERFIKRKHKK